jgi:hypothetical protein
MSIILSIIADANLKGIKNAIKEFESLKTAGQKASFAISKAAIPATAALAGLAAAGYKATQAASDLSEESSKIGVIFGDNAKQIQDFSKAAATNLGQSQTEAMAAAGTFAILGKSAGMTGQRLVDFSKQFTVLASDLASFNNTSPEDAVLAIGAALRGESEPIRRYGVMLNDATLRARAFSMGLVDNVRTALTPQTKALAAQAEILAQTTLAQGDFARTSDGAANAQRILNAQMKNASAEIGTALLPVLEKTLPLLQNMATFAGKNAPVIVGLSVALGALATALIVARGAMIVYNTMAVIMTLVNKALAISGFAVQISTGVGIASAIAGAAVLAGIAIDVARATKTNNDYADSVDGMTGSWDLFGKITSGPLGVIDRLVAENQAKSRIASDKAKSAAAAAKDAAKSLLADTKKALEAGKQVLRDYASGLAETLRGYISLSSAVNIATDSETAYQDALKERMAAYEQLNKLQKSGLYTTEAMAEATDRVARAEAGLNTAQSQRKSYSQQFAEQIAAAKKFGGQLQQLIAAGLGRSGLAQLMNLGPVAGSQVAADLLAGTGGMTVASLNADLGAIDTAGAALGQSAIAGDMGLLNQASANRSGNNVTIHVTGADPQAVVDALKRYMKTNGKVPIKVTG